MTFAQASGTPAAARACARTCAVLVLALLGWGCSQASWPVETLIPDTIAVRAPIEDLRIDLSDYPPQAFPARYPLRTSEGTWLPIQVFSNAPDFWTLDLQIEGVESDDGTTLLPPSQVLYRLNGGPWLRADGSPQVIFSGSGATGGWLAMRLELAVELRGSELSGGYRFEARLTARRQGI